ncbi:MAG: 4Fe-4S dicluster domain-containing protein, partial [Candidatus Methylomirabilales bacterium]
AEVPCLGMVTSGWLLQCLHLGATAVGLLPCPPDRCRFGRRDTVRGRVDYVREFLLLLGGAADRVKLIDLADESELAHALASVPEQDKETPPDAPRGALSLTPPQGAANAVLGLAERYGARDRSLEHPDSPLGVVEVEAGCTGCGTCAGVCPSGALVFEQDANEITLAFDPRLCVACRQCVPVCPESVLRVRRVTDLGRLALGKFALHRDSEARCEACGGPVAPRAMLTRISALLGNDQATVSAITRYCVSCRGTLPGGPL